MPELPCLTVVGRENNENADMLPKQLEEIMNDLSPEKRAFIEKSVSAGFRNPSLVSFTYTRQERSKLDLLPVMRTNSQSFAGLFA